MRFPKVYDLRRAVIDKEELRTRDVGELKLKKMQNF